MRLVPAGPFLESRTGRISVMVALFAAGLALRLPSLQMVPRFEDEGVEVQWALDIARGNHLPLTGADVYYGPLFSYLVAGMFKLFGENILWPRLVTAVFGALTVPATFVLGRVVAGGRAGLTAGLFALTSPMLVVVSSHFGLSNSLTPFFATATLIAAYIGVTGRRTGVLTLGGFLAALTLETHPLSAVLLVAIGVWYLTTCPRREWFLRREMYLGLCAFVAGYSPLIWTLDARRWYAYAFEPATSMSQYLQRLGRLCEQLIATVTAAGGRLWEGFSGMHWLGIIIQLVILVALIAGLRVARSRRFLIPIFLIPVVLFPLVTQSFDSRYLMFLTPIASVAVGAAFSRWWERIARAWLVSALVLVLGTWVMAIVRVEQVHAQRGITNAAFFELRETLANNNACRGGILLEDMDALTRGAGADRTWPYFNFQAVRAVLVLDRCVRAVAPAAQLVDAVRTRTASAWLVIPEQSVPLFAGERGFRRVSVIAPGPAVRPDWQLTLVYVGSPR